MKPKNSILPFKDAVIQAIALEFHLHDLKITGDIYFDLIEDIVSQQLSGKVAPVIFSRFLDIFPSRYPDAKMLADLPIEKLRSAGLSNAKSQYVKNVAQFSLQEDLSIDRVDKLNDSELISLLTRIKGVGIWTAQMVLIFSLNRPDVFPIDDMAVREGMRSLYSIDQNINGKELKEKLIEISENWRPNRTLGTRYVWLYVNKKKELKMRF
jgi:DNA-3-methyladenine glycosylase II